MERFYFKHDSNKNVLTVEVTEGVAFNIIKMLREMLPIEFNHMTMETVNVLTEEGISYKNVRRYSIPVLGDKVNIFFEAGKKVLAQGIIDSVPNSDN